MIARPPRILVTDDDAEFRRAVGEGLSRRGYDVVQAGDGREAIERILHDRFELTLVDLQMPGVDGLDVIRVVRDTATPRVIGDASVWPCVLISGALDADVESHAIELGTFRCLTKPVRLKTLGGVVDDALAVFAAR